MRIVEMQPKEKRPVRVLLQPLQCPRHAFSSATFNQTKIAILELLWSKRVIVKIEAASQPPTPVEDKCTHHRAGPVSMILERLSNRAKLGIQRRPRKILHAVLKRICPCQNHGVRRPGQRHLRNRAFEHDPVMRQRVECRRLHILGSVTTDVVRAYGVNRDQNYIRMRLGSVSRGSCSE